MAARINPTIFDKLAASQNTWNIKEKDKPLRGPYSTQQMQTFVTEKRLGPQVMVALVGDPLFREVQNVPMFARLFKDVAPPPPAAEPGAAPGEPQLPRGGIVGDSVIAGVDGFKEGVLQVDLARFGERALRANVRRELDWLLNTTNLESTIDLTPYPRVKTSVLNYGVADLAGKAQSRTSVNARAAKIRDAIRAFEPRLDDKSLAVDVVSKANRENAVTYVISGDITAAAEALRVQYYTDVETDTGNADVRE